MDDIAPQNNPAHSFPPFVPHPDSPCSQYVSEAVASIAEVPLSVKDLPAGLQVCGLLHRRYAEFGEQVGGGGIVCREGLVFY